MNIHIDRVKIVVTIPLNNVNEVRNAICDIGAGVIGNYTHCSMSTKCIGTFKPKVQRNKKIKDEKEYVGIFSRNEIKITDEFFGGRLC